MEAFLDFWMLLETIRGRSTGQHSLVHGEEHWRCVGWVGAHLAGQTPGCDPLLALLFSLFHDSMRECDGNDPDHGTRGGALAKALNGTGFYLGPVKLAALELICANHTSGGTTTDPTMGVCWDSDRLNLWRVGTRPHPKYLSTAIARKRICWARAVVDSPPSWAKVYAQFQPLLRER